jgi:hypothetical protein
MNMTKQVKENGDIIWKTIAMALLSACLYFIIDIHKKVEVGYKSSIEQPLINSAMSSRVISLEDLAERIGLDLSELNIRVYKLESKQN